MNTHVISRNGTAYSLIGLDHAPAIVLIHGLGLTHHIWDAYILDFSKNYRVLTYDLLGHGKSALPQKPPILTSYSVQLLELMDELSLDTAALIGFSLGGMINRRFAMDNPKRVSALCILNSPHERSLEAQKLVEQRAGDIRTNFPEVALLTILERWFTRGYRTEYQDIVNEIGACIVANDPIVYAQCRQVLAKGVLELIRPEPPLKLPTLVMTCENDSGSTPAMSYAIASEIAGAEVVIVPELQHMGLVEKPHLFREPLLGFLNSNKY